MRTEEALLVLESSPEGLLNEEALKRLDRYGPNILEEKNTVTPFKVLVRQLANVIVWVLATAALIALLAGEVINFWAIIGIILFVIIMGFLQEYRAEKSMEALKKFVQPLTRVRRENLLMQLAKILYTIPVIKVPHNDRERTMDCSCPDDILLGDAYNKRYKVPHRWGGVDILFLPLGIPATPLY